MKWIRVTSKSLFKLSSVIPKKCHCKRCWQTVQPMSVSVAYGKLWLLEMNGMWSYSIININLYLQSSYTYSMMFHMYSVCSLSPEYIHQCMTIEFESVIFNTHIQILKYSLKSVLLSGKMNLSENTPTVTYTWFWWGSMPNGLQLDEPRKFLTAKDSVHCLKAACS